MRDEFGGLCRDLNVRSLICVFVLTRWILFSLLMGGGVVSALEPLGNAAAVRSLPRDEAARDLPVSFKGVITFIHPGEEQRNIVVENEGTGIFIHIANAERLDAAGRAMARPYELLEIGREIEIFGVTRPGQYAPVVHADRLRTLGITELPAAEEFELSEVLTGAMDCQRLMLEGVFQGADLMDGATLRLALAVPTGRLVVECPDPGDWTREKLLGARVRLTAVCGTYFNLRGEMVGLHLMVARPGDIVVEKPGPLDPFAAPRVPVSALKAFSPQGPNLERVQITGLVTLSRPGEYFYLEEDGRAVRVFAAHGGRIAPGTAVVASGFIDPHQSFAELREAEVKLLGAQGLASPPLMSFKGLIERSERVWGQAMAPDFNGRLITLRGEVSKVEPMDDGGRRLVINTDGDPVTAMLDADGGAEALDGLAEGSRIEVTGVCELEFPSAQLLVDFPNPSGFSILLRSADDLRVLRAAPWWTPGRLWLLLGGTAVLLAGVLTWNVILRRLIAQRGEQLAAEMRARDRAEVEFDATLRERTRLAADLHDTLEQALTGLSFQLDTSSVLATRAPDASARHLDLGRQLLTRSREDLRRSIWNLRARDLDGHSLAEAVEGAALQATEGRPIGITVEETGTPHPLPEFIAGNLLLLAQEAMTNAIKHGEPRTIAVNVGYHGDEVVLSVRDDGAGFDPGAAPGLHEGHFGLQGMRERANRLDGEIKIESRRGDGTRITVVVPVPARVDQAPSSTRSSPRS